MTGGVQGLGVEVVKNKDAKLTSKYYMVYDFSMYNFIHQPLHAGGVITAGGGLPKTLSSQPPIGYMHYVNLTVLGLLVLVI